jgi:hypothetical protein
LLYGLFWGIPGTDFFIDGYGQRSYPEEVRFYNHFLKAVDPIAESNLDTVGQSSRPWHCFGNRIPAVCWFFFEMLMAVLPF